MKSFVVFFALVALACAATLDKKDEQRDKRFLTAYNAYPYSSYVAPAVGYTAPAVGYVAPAVGYTAPAVSVAAPAVSVAAPAVVPHYGYDTLGYNTLGYRSGWW